MFKIEVIADSSGVWVSNALTFDSREEAEQYAADLAVRWTLVREWRVVELDDDFVVVGGREYDEPEATYKIVRFIFDGDNELVETGLSLAEAQAHCKRDDTHGEGWFDGYEEE